jgi:hypothetical protein
MEALSVAYAWCFQIDTVSAVVDTEASESAATGAEVTISNRNHVRRLMNLCVEPFFALWKFDWQLSLAPLATDGIRVPLRYYSLGTGGGSVDLLAGRRGVPSPVRSRVCEVHCRHSPQF